MNRVVLSVLAIFTSLFALVFSLIMVIPLTIAALITGKKIQSQLRRQYNNKPSENFIEGEYQDISDKKTADSDN